jgi:4-amino-4-deoxy-L-arabinose transferase-like glycosyltransferase
LWSGWLVVTGLVFSYGKGIIHPYYTVALAPAIGALVGIGATTLWRIREQVWARLVLAVTVVATVLWADHLLARSPSWHPWLRGGVLGVGLTLGAVVLVSPVLLGRRVAWVSRLLAIGMLVVALAGPMAYSLDTAGPAHTGAIPSAGPTAAVAGFGRPGGFGGPAGVGGPGSGFGGLGAPGGAGAGRVGGAAGVAGVGGAGPSFGGGQRPGPAGGGLLDAGQVSGKLAAALRSDAGSYRWVAAVVGAEQASGYQLATDEPVMAIGGFNGTDPAPSLSEFEQYVHAGRIHYFIASGGRGGPGGPGAAGGGASSAIATWVESHFTATSIGGTTVYDLVPAHSDRLPG